MTTIHHCASPALVAAARQAAPVIRRWLERGWLRIVNEPAKSPGRRYVPKAGSRYGSVTQLARQIVDRGPLPYGEITRLAERHGVNEATLSSAIRIERIRRGQPTRQAIRTL